MPIYFRYHCNKLFAPLWALRATDSLSVAILVSTGWTFWAAGPKVLKRYVPRDRITIGKSGVDGNGETTGVDGLRPR